VETPVIGIGWPMTDILQGLVSGGLPFLFAWVLPSAIAVSAFALEIFPLAKHLAVLEAISGMSGASQALVMAFVAVAIALIMNAVDTPLYRVVEGYVWPGGLQNWGSKRQLSKRCHLETKTDRRHEGWRRDLLDERLQRYPAGDDLAPTALGNALKAFEGYALDHFNLNSQLLWVDLYGVVGDETRAEYERSRAAVDFFVATFYLSALYGVISLAAGIVTGKWAAAIGAGIAFALMPAWYRLAVQSTSYWAKATKALVDLGRKPLADQLGLRLPSTTDAERRMWGIVNAFVYYKYEDEAGKALDPFRLKSL